MQPNLGISNENRAAVANLLKPLLADLYLLYTKTRNYHWNVVGMHFNDLHKFFEGQYEELDEFIDQVAERIRTLGFISPGTLSEFVKLGRLKEQPGKQLNAKDMLADLLTDHETVIRTLRDDLTASQDQYKDAGTCDFLTGLMEDHEKMAWMIRSFLQNVG